MIEDLIKSGEAPEWMNEEGYLTIARGYLLENETPKGMYKRLAKTAASYYTDNKKWEKKFFDVMWKGWLCPASPVLSNLGTTRGMPISCFSIHVGDSVDSIFQKNHELATLSKNGGGVGIYMGDVRGRGAKIAGNGASEGIVPWCKVYDTTTMVVSQGGVRRGASAVYLDIEHSDIDEFLNIRRPVGDPNRRCLNINHGVCISNDWMNSMIAGDSTKRVLWSEILKNRVETGEPYLFFKDNVNSQNPESYKKNNLHVSTSNICCLAKDTQVATKNGPFKIQDLVGKTVEIWDGNQWVKNNSFKSYGQDDIYRIHLANGSFVDSNAKHRWFQANSYNDIRLNKYREITTSELKIGGWLEQHSIEFHGNNTTNGAYLKGFLISDGTHSNDVPILNLYFTKYGCIDKLIESTQEILPDENLRSDCILTPGFGDENDYTGTEGTYGVQRRRKMQGISARKKSLIKWVTEYKESLPEEVFYWSRETKLDFISGLLDGDGTFGKHCSLQISNVNKRIIEDLQILFRTLNVSSSIDFDGKDDLRNPTWRLTLSSSDMYKLAPNLNCYRLKFEGKKPNRKLTGWRRIKNIEYIGKSEVFCPTVPTTKKFALANGLMTGNTEITLHTDQDHTFVCCLSSVNLTKYDEWKGTDFIQSCIYFLDAVMEEFIQKTENKKGFEASRNSAIKGRPLGLGVLGWHSLLQEMDVEFDSFDAMKLNAEIFRTIRRDADKATAQLAIEKGEPEWCKGLGRRNTHTIAIAPTVSNSAISGGVSAGIEPLVANIFAAKSAKGTFFRKNPTLTKILQKLNKDNADTWAEINKNGGSVQSLDFLTDHQKRVFLTARELNQHAIIKQAAQRQAFVDQAQSINLFFGTNSDPKYIHQVHLAAWELGLKTLYYLRAEGVLKGDSIFKDSKECLACEG